MTLSKRRPRLGFLGLGWIGRNRLEAAVRADVADIVAVADSDALACATAAELIPGVRIASGLEALLELPLDGLVIATPSAQHAEQTARALEAGIAVYCQKPLSRTGKEAHALIELARKQQLLLGVDLCYRYLRATEAVKTLLDSGALGSVFAANLVFHNAYGPDKPWFYDARLSGGGCLMDLGIHLLDLAAWMLNEDGFHVEAAHLFCKGAPLIDANETEDYASAALTLGGRIAVNITCSWRASVGKDAAIEASFYGTQGGATIRNVGGSFYDFESVHHQGTSRQPLVEPPDDWGGRALLRWIGKLSSGVGFDPECTAYAASGIALDAIYARARKDGEERGAVPLVALSAC
jgi:predicted dehydrogenase